MKTCIKCGEIKKHDEFEKQRNTCRSCRNEQFRQARYYKKHNNIVEYKCEQMARDARSRVLAPSRKHKRGYQNLVEPFGFKNTGDLKSYLYRNFYQDIKALLDAGETPSIDRIDTSIGYTENNIRIISFKENTRLGVESRKRKVRLITPMNEEYLFDSVTECGLFLGIPNITHTSKISSWIKNDGKYKRPEGYQFEYVEE